MNKPKIFSELVEMYKASPSFDSLSERTKIIYDDRIKFLVKTGGIYKIHYSSDAESFQTIAFQWYNQLSHLKQGTVSNYYRNFLRQILSVVYSWGIKHLGIAKYSNPTLFMPVLKVEKKDPSPFDKEDMEKITTLMKVQGYYKLKHTQLLTCWVIRFLFETGMRPAEMMALRITDVVTDEAISGTPDRNRYLQIIGGKGREAGKVSRYLYVTEEVGACLEFFMNHRSTRKVVDSDHLVLSPMGKPIINTHLNKSFHEIMARAGLQCKELYDLRRGCATEIIHNPAYGVTVAQKQLGHKNLATTMLYESLGKKKSALLFKGHK